MAGRLREMRFLLTRFRIESMLRGMNELLIGYARVSTNEQDLTAQQNALERLGVSPSLIYCDHGLTGTNRAGRDCAKLSQHAEAATPWSLQSSTGLPDHCGMRATSWMSSPPKT